MSLTANPYSYKLDIGSLGTPVVGSGYITVSCNPDGAKLKKYRDDKSLFIVRLKVEGELLFSGSTYRALETLRDAGEKYVGIKIYYSGSLRLTGKLMLYGTWDENKNTCKCYVNTDDDYNTILANLDAETNIILTASHTASLFEVSTLRTITLPCYSGTELEARQYYDPDGQISSDPLSTHPDWVWFTNTSTTPCSGGQIYEYKGAWISFEIEGEWQPTFEIFSNQYYKIGETSTSNVYDDRYEEFHLEYDILAALLAEADSSISISSSTYCTYFTVTYTNIDRLMIADKSDVKDPTASDPATFEFISLETMLKYYRWMFNLEWTIDSGVFKLRRTDDFSAATGDNIFTAFTTYQKRYSTTGEKTAKETWKFENTGTNKFRDSYFDYGTNDDSFITYDMPEVNNDMARIANETDQIDDNGIVWAATNWNGVRNVIRNVNSVSNPSDELKNGEMAAETLIRRHQEINRPYPTAIQDAISNRTFDPKPDKEQVFVNAPIYDPNDIDFDQYGATSLGNMVIDELSIDLALGFAEIKGRV